MTAVDASANRLTVELRDGTERTPRLITYDPRRQQGVSVYREEERAFSVADRVQLTAPAQELKIANREIGTIDGMEANAVSKVVGTMKSHEIDSEGDS